MYPQHLLTLSKDKRFEADPPSGAHVAERRNPACGDEIRLGVEICEGRVGLLRYRVKACAVTHAAAAALGQAVEGLPLHEARVRAETALAFFRGEGGWNADWGTADMPALGALRAFPMRLACVRLPWEAFLAALPES